MPHYMVESGNQARASPGMRLLAGWGVLPWAQVGGGGDSFGKSELGTLRTRR